MSPTDAPAGLTPPWDTDQAALNAAEILADRKTYREDRSATVWCHGGHAVGLVRVFVGPHDDGTVRTWLLVPTYRLKERVVPPLCAPAPQPGEAWRTMYGHCKRCRAGVVVFYPDAAGNIAQFRAAGEEASIVFRAGMSERADLAAGDLVTTVQGGDRWSDGPAGSWLVHAGMPTLGVVTP